MIRSGSFVALSVAAALCAAASPLLAQSRGYYAVTAATAPARSSFVTRSVVWKCDGASCSAPKAGQRDAVMCELVAREVGTLASFSANGTAFDADALARCNTRAK